MMTENLRYTKTQTKTKSRIKRAILYTKIFLAIFLTFLYIIIGLYQTRVLILGARPNEVASKLYSQGGIGTIWYSQCWFEEDIDYKRLDYVLIQPKDLPKECAESVRNAAMDAGIRVSNYYAGENDRDIEREIDEIIKKSKSVILFKFIFCPATVIFVILTLITFLYDKKAR